MDDKHFVWMKNNYLVDSRSDRLVGVLTYSSGYDTWKWKGQEYVSKEGAVRAALKWANEHFGGDAS